MKNILFIEDESALQKTLGDALSQQGYEVVGAMDGEEGLAKAEQLSPDLVLLDLVLPKKDGFEVLQALKQGEKTRDIPVIVLTNLEELKEVEKALALGATTYLVKSNYRLHEVVDKIRGVIGS